LIYALVLRPAYRFPIAYDHYLQIPREDLPEQIQFTRDQLEVGGVIVLFDAPTLDEDLELVQTLKTLPLMEVEGAYFFEGEVND
jgi:hypothetical protein